MGCSAYPGFGRPPPWISGDRQVTISGMPSSRFSVGDRVTRVMDGATGVVEVVGPMGSLDVRWDSSGMMSVVRPTLLARI